MAQQKFKTATNINFVKWAPVGCLISALFIAASIYIWVSMGDSKYGVDFRGGTEVVVRFNDAVEAGDIRDALEKSGISEAVVQKFEALVGSEQHHEYSIKVKSTGDAKEGDKIVAALGQQLPGKTFDLMKQDYVGPVVGEQIRSDGLKALIGAIICILAYVSFRFEWRFAVGAIAALVHDVVITGGLFLYSGREFSVAVLAALLTIIGYSLNDNIVILDRVRENMNDALRNGGKDARSKVSAKLGDIFNDSLNQTLSRTIITSLTTLIVVVSLWIFGGGALSDLALALVIGIVAGCYSTIFMVMPVILYLKR